MEDGNAPALRQAGLCCPDEVLNPPELHLLWAASHHLWLVKLHTLRFSHQVSFNFVASTYLRDKQLQAFIQLHLLTANQHNTSSIPV